MLKHTIICLIFSASSIMATADAPQEEKAPRQDRRYLLWLDDQDDVPAQDQPITMHVNEHPVGPYIINHVSFEPAQQDDIERAAHVIIVPEPEPVLPVEPAETPIQIRAHKLYCPTSKEDTRLCCGDCFCYINRDGHIERPKTIHEYLCSSNYRRARFWATMTSAWCGVLGILIYNYATS